jgi:hypothetical protein
MARRDKNMGPLILGLTALYLFTRPKAAAALGSTGEGETGDGYTPPGEDGWGYPPVDTGVPCRPVPQRIPIGGSPAPDCKRRTVLPVGYRFQVLPPRPLFGRAGPNADGWSIPQEWYFGMLADSTGGGQTVTPEDVEPEVGCAPCLPLPTAIGPSTGEPCPGCGWAPVLPNPLGAPWPPPPGFGGWSVAELP